MRRQHWIVSDYQRIVTNVVLIKLDTAESVSRLKLLNMCLSCCWMILAACWAYTKQRAEKEEAAAAVALVQRGVAQRLQLDDSETAASVECHNLSSTTTHPAIGATSCSGAGRGGVGVAPPHGGSGRSGKAAAAAPVISFPDNVPPATAFYVAVTASAAVTDVAAADAAAAAAAGAAENSGGGGATKF